MHFLRYPREACAVVGPCQMGSFVERYFLGISMGKKWSGEGNSINCGTDTIFSRKLLLIIVIILLFISATYGERIRCFLFIYSPTIYYCFYECERGPKHVSNRPDLRSLFNFVLLLCCFPHSVVMFLRSIGVMCRTCHRTALATANASELFT